MGSLQFAGTCWGRIDGGKGTRESDLSPRDRIELAQTETKLAFSGGVGGCLSLLLLDTSGHTRGAVGGIELVHTEIFLAPKYQKVWPMVTCVMNL